ncbi:MAG: FAD-binding oxidoreductase [Verrucomicrobia bacterium]|nr:FAD-binding oxidoreductase [Verrucomicrobiota bacterium]
MQEDNITALTAAVRGSVITPASPEYESARKVYNAMIDRRPAIIVRCANVRDVRTAIDFAREQGLTVAVRGGGHNGAGLAVCDDGLVIDLSCMKSVRVDPATNTVRAESGCTQADINHAAGGFGLAVPVGVISTTGIAGLTLGGGTGYLTRKYGLALDNLLEADLVLADGSFMTASAKNNPDLFWAIRGGGGNFGVVTSFLFKAHPVPQVFAGPMLWDWEHAREVLEWYREISPNLPEDLYGFLAFLTVPPGPPFPEELHLKVMCGIVWAYSGPLDQAEAAFQPIRKFRAPRFELVGPMPYLTLQSLFDALYPPGHQWYWRGDFLNEIPDAAIDQHLKFGSQLPTLQSTMHLYPVDGFPARIDRSETAFSFRDAKWSMVIVGVDPEPANAAKITAWTKDYWAALHPYSMGGAYVNFMMEEGADRIKATYRDNYQRLVAVKGKYDPTNFFHVNQNIKPN